MGGIPIEYLSSMGTYCINNVHGIPTITVKISDSRPIIESHTSTLSLFVKDRRFKVVGVDVKTIWSNGRYLLILYADHTNCMVFILDTLIRFPDSLRKFLKDPGSCFVVNQNLLDANYTTFQGSRVGVGELAARVLKKPGITASNWLK
uniref:Uncharacterized protein n=1 Tax=Chenopodium quinoa TaxID=63459 RepID=A0A803KMZ9_CHEQI